MSFLKIATATLALVAAGGTAQAASVSPDVIFGSGNANGSFTVATGSYNAGIPDATPNLELGLRAKLRFNDSNAPENTFNYDGVDTYTFDAGLPPTGFGFAPGSTSTAVWNFEWSINTDVGFFPVAGLTSLDALTYVLSLDGDPTSATNFLAFDPINQPNADHAIGAFNTGNGGGTTSTGPTNYAALINTNSVAQNSWNYEFFDGPGNPLASFSGADAGEYAIKLEAFHNGLSIASTTINVISQSSVGVVPVPASLPLLAAGLIAFGVLARRKRT